MSDTIVLSPLASVDAVAIRSGSAVLVHVNPDVPQWARLIAAEHLRRKVGAAEGRFAAAWLSRGEAMQLANEVHRDQPLVPSLRDAGISAGIAMLPGLAFDIPQLDPEPLAELWDILDLSVPDFTGDLDYFSVDLMGVV